MIYLVSSPQQCTRYPSSFVALIALTVTLAWSNGNCSSVYYAAIILGCITFINRKISTYKQFFFNTSLLVSICLAGIQQYNYRATQANALYQRLNNKKCTIQATVSSIEYSEGGRYHYVTTLCTQKIKVVDTNECKTANHTVRIYTMQYPKIKVADTVNIDNITIKKPNNGSFFRYLIKEGISGTSFLNKETFTVISRPNYSIRRWLHNTRLQLVKQFKKILSPKAATLFLSIFMGKKLKNNKHMKQLKKSCLAWGVSHHLARSGLHLIIILLVWHFILKLISISLYKRIGIVLLLSFLYHLLTWPSISFYRAMWAFILHHLCVFFGIQSNSFYLLTLVTLTTLLFNPFYLFFLDFQLSFGITMALTWYNTISNTITIQQHHLSNS